MSALQLDTGAHQARTLMTWLGAQPGDAFARAGLAAPAAGSSDLAVRNATTIVTSGDVGAMRELFAPLSTPSGFPVTDHTAMCESTVYACLNVISGAIVQLPVHQYRGSTVGNREAMEPTPLWWMLNEQPCDAWTAASWKEWIVRCVGLRGDQVTQIVRGAGGLPIALRPHHPDLVNILRNPERPERLLYGVQDLETGRTYGLDQDDVLHFTGWGFNGTRSLSLVQHAARNAISNSLASSDYMGRSIGEGAMPQIALTYPHKLAPDQAALLRQSFVATYTGTGSRKLPLILTEGGTANQLTMSPIDMDLLASRHFEKETICQAAGVPPVMIGDNEKTSSWGTGVEQISLGFVRYSLKPRLRRWSEEMNRKLFRRAGMFLEFDLAELIKGDSKAQADSDRAALGGPGSGDAWLSVNEVRRSRNLAPIPGAEFDKPFRAPAKLADTLPKETPHHEAEQAAAAAA